MVVTSVLVVTPAVHNSYIQLYHCVWSSRVRELSVTMQNPAAIQAQVSREQEGTHAGRANLPTWLF